MYIYTQYIDFPRYHVLLYRLPIYEIVWRFDKYFPMMILTNGMPWYGMFVWKPLPFICAYNEEKYCLLTRRITMMRNSGELCTKDI